MSDVPETKTLADPIVFLICFATHEIHAMGSGETIPQRLHLDGSSQVDWFVSRDGQERCVSSERVPVLSSRCDHDQSIGYRLSRVVTRFWRSTTTPVH